MVKLPSAVSASSARSEASTALGHRFSARSDFESIRNRAEDNTESWEKLVELAGCSHHRKDSLHCLRRLPASKIKDIIERNALTFNPVTDNITYTSHPQRRRLNSTATNPVIARVPLLIGSNACDAWPLIPATQNDTASYLRSTFPTFPEPKIQEILSAYPLSPTRGIRSPASQIATIFTEYAFQCPSKLIADGTVDSGIPAWRYVFNASFPNSEIFPGSGAYHSSEIGLVFGTYEKAGATGFQEELSRVMQKGWADFAKKPHKGPGWGGVPGVGVLGGWAGDGIEAVTEVDTAEIDGRCGLFGELYAAVI